MLQEEPLAHDAVKKALAEERLAHDETKIALAEEQSARATELQAFGAAIVAAHTADSSEAAAVQDDLTAATDALA